MLIKLFRHYSRPYLGMIIIILLLQAGATAANLSLPTVNADLINNGVQTGNTHYIAWMGVWMTLITLGQVMCTIASAYFGARTAMSIGRDIRQDLFDQVQVFSSREVARFGAPSLITRTTNDVQQVQMLILMVFVFIVNAPIMMVGGVIMAINHSPRLSLIIVVVVPLLALVIGLVAVKLTPLFRQVQGKIDTINRVMREQITGIRVIRAFVRDRYEQERFGDANGDLMRLQKSTGYWFSLVFPIVMLIMNLSSVGVIWFGGKLINTNHLQVGDLTAFITYLFQILMSIMMASMMFFMWPRAEVCAGRINEVLERETTVEESPDAVTDMPEKGKIEFRDANFRYPGAEFPILKDINFTAKPGQTTAIIGSTGSGKTTLLNLIPRLFDATDGDVLVGGVNVRDLGLQALWGSIGLIPQKPYLFSGTVGSNVRYGKEGASDEEVWQALEIAQAADFVRDMDGQLDAPIAQGGTNVSGGQRQRLAIARALVRKPDIYLFDDSFSALDFATDAALRAALVPYTRESSVIIVAQRVGTIREADQIIVLDDGEIVGVGTHHDLLESCETYQEIVYSQLSAEEAA